MPPRKPMDGLAAKAKARPTHRRTPTVPQPGQLVAPDGTASPPTMSQAIDRLQEDLRYIHAPSFNFAGGAQDTPRRDDELIDPYAISRHATLAGCRVIEYSVAQPWFNGGGRTAYSFYQCSMAMLFFVYMHSRQGRPIGPSWTEGFLRANINLTAGRYDLARHGLRRSRFGILIPCGSFPVHGSAGLMLDIEYNGSDIYLPQYLVECTLIGGVLNG